MKTRIDYICEATAGVGTILQTDKILQTISMILTCISIVVSLCFTLYNWYKVAKKDGKITKDEIDEAVKTTKEHIDKIESTIKKDGDKNGKIY